MAVRDFVHDEQIVRAVVDQLKAELPESWMTGDDECLHLQGVQFGDLRDYRLDAGQRWENLCPLILVRLDRSERAPSYGGLGGVEAQVVPLRVLHVRTREQCRDLADLEKPITPAEARAQCAKVISQALFANRDLGHPSLTSEDGSARVIELRPRAIVYDAEQGDVALATTHDLVALAIDLEVVVRTQ